MTGIDWFYTAQIALGVAGMVLAVLTYWLA